MKNLCWSYFAIVGVGIAIFAWSTPKMISFESKPEPHTCLSPEQFEKLKTLYITKFNEQNTRITALEKRGSGMLPPVRGMKWK